MPLPAQGSAYSINRGLWGITIGGQETLTSENAIPESAWVLSPTAFTDPLAESEHALTFDSGIPTELDGEAMSPVDLIEALEKLAGVTTALAAASIWAIPCWARKAASRSKHRPRSR